MKKTVSIIGGGPAAMIAAIFLDSMKHNVTIFEKGKALGRKFLVAGKGGFNLTHSESIDTMLTRYLPAGLLDECLESFDNEDLRFWLRGLGIDTYIGSSKRVFPVKGIKPIEVLNAIKEKLDEQAINIRYGHEWVGWTEDNDVLFADGLSIRSDYTIFAMGGGSWSVTGSDGAWLEHFTKKGISTKAFAASNCAMKVAWPSEFKEQYAGEPVKNIAIEIDGNTHTGECVITDFGLEGNAVYALSPMIRASLASDNEAIIHIDMKPQLTADVIEKKLKDHGGNNISKALLHALKLPKWTLHLLKQNLSKSEYIDLSVVSSYIKSIPIKVIGLAPVDEAISTAGGIALDELTEDFELTQIPNQYCIGEMVDWDTMTGGYLLQGSFSMGVYVARHIDDQFKQFFES